MWPTRIGTRRFLSSSGPYGSAVVILSIAALITSGRQPTSRIDKLTAARRANKSFTTVSGLARDRGRRIDHGRIDSQHLCKDKRLPNFLERVLRSRSLHAALVSFEAHYFRASRGLLPAPPAAGMVRHARHARPVSVSKHSTQCVIVSIPCYAHPIYWAPGPVDGMNVAFARGHLISCLNACRRHGTKGSSRHRLNRTVCPQTISILF